MALVQRGIDLGVSSQTGDVTASLLGGFLKAVANAASTALISLVVVAFFLLESSRIMQIIRGDLVQKRPFLSQASQVARTAVQYFGIRTRLNLVTGVGVTRFVCSSVLTTRYYGACLPSF